MSTEYIALKKIAFSELFDGRLERFGVREHIKDDETDDLRRCLTDGRNFLWVYRKQDGSLAALTRFGANAPGKILRAVAETFDADIVSEYEPQYWGFETREEWDLAWEKMSEEDENRHYEKIMKYVSGEETNFRPGTIGMTEAKIAKKLVAESPDLASLDRKKDLLQAIEEVYRRDHAVVIKLDEAEVAAAKMLVTHEDDLPKG